jgi:hypothetical protein
MFNRVLEIVRDWFEQLLAGFGPELIVNGGFEEDGGFAGGVPHKFPDAAVAAGIQVLARNDQTILGWEIDPFSNQPVAWVLTENTFGFRAAKNGGRLFVDLTNQGNSWTNFEGGLISAGVLSAQFDTEAGSRYLLSMLIGTFESVVKGFERGLDSRGPSAVRVVAGDTFGARLDHPGGDLGSATQWVERSLVFIAKGPQTEVEIRGWIPPDLLAQRQGGSPRFIGLDNVSVRKLWRVPPWQWPRVR